MSQMDKSTAKNKGKVNIPFYTRTPLRKKVKAQVKKDLGMGPKKTPSTAASRAKASLQRRKIKDAAVKAAGVARRKSEAKKRRQGKK